MNGQPAIQLFPGQLVIEAIEIMLRHERYVLPIYFSGRCVGLIHFKDLIEFLVSCKDGNDLLFHKFNYNLESAITILTTQMHNSQT